MPVVQLSNEFKLLRSCAGAAHWGYSKKGGSVAVSCENPQRSPLQRLVQQGVSCDIASVGLRS